MKLLNMSLIVASVIVSHCYVGALEGDVVLLNAPVTTAQSTDSTGGAATNIPPPPPMPPLPSRSKAAFSHSDAAGAPPPPPPPPPLGRYSATLTTKNTSITEVKETLDKELNAFLDKNGSKLAANLINLYMYGNKTDIVNGILTATNTATLLQKRLDKDLEQIAQQLSSAPTINLEFAKKLQTFFLTLKGELTEVTNTNREIQRRKTINAGIFNALKGRIEKQAKEYFTMIISSSVEIKALAADLPVAFNAFKDAEIILERLAVLVNSLHDLAYLSSQTRNMAFSEPAVRSAISLINLRRLILNRLDEISAQQEKTPGKNNTAILPTGVEITETEYLQDALKYINNTIDGTNQLHKLLDISKMLSHSMSSIDASKISVNDATDPTKQLVTLTDTIVRAGELLKEAKVLVHQSNFSQFGEMFNRTDTGFAGALSKTAYSLSEPIRKIEFNYSGARQLFKEQRIFEPQEIVALHMHILLNNLNICSSYARNIVSIMVNKYKYKLSSYLAKRTTRAAQTEQKESLVKFIATSGDNEIELGSDKDPKQLNNSVSLKTIQKNCLKVTETLQTVLSRFNEIDDILARRLSFSKEKEPGELLSLVTAMVNSVIIEEPKFTLTDDGHLILPPVSKTTGSPLLSTDDFTNATFVFAQNCDLIVKTKSALLLTSVGTDNSWVLGMSEQISQNLEKIIANVRGIGEKHSADLSEVIEKLTKLKDPIDKAINATKVPPAVAQEEAPVAPQVVPQGNAPASEQSSVTTQTPSVTEAMTTLRPSLRPTPQRRAILGGTPASTVEPSVEVPPAVAQEEAPVAPQLAPQENAPASEQSSVTTQTPSVTEAMTTLRPSLRPTPQRQTTLGETPATTVESLVEKIPHEESLQEPGLIRPSSRILQQSSPAAKSGTSSNDAMRFLHHRDSLHIRTRKAPAVPAA